MTIPHDKQLNQRATATRAAPAHLTHGITSTRIPAALRVQCAVVELRPGVTRRARRRYWARVRDRVRQRSLVLPQRHGLCMMLAVGHRLGVDDRRLLVAALLDQPQTRHIILNTPADVAWYLSDAFEPRLEDPYESQTTGDGATEHKEPETPHRAAELIAARQSLRNVLARACLGYVRTVEATRQKLNEATRG